MSSMIQGPRGVTVTGLISVKRLSGKILDFWNIEMWKSPWAVRVSEVENDSSDDV